MLLSYRRRRRLAAPSSPDRRINDVVDEFRIDFSSLLYRRAGVDQSRDQLVLGRVSSVHYHSNALLIASRRRPFSRRH